MSEQEIIDWVIKLTEPKRGSLTPQQKLIFDARVKTLAGIKQKLKRIEYFGGVETLIAKASITGQSEKLF
jgi:hypothetical protein